MSVPLSNAPHVSQEEAGATLAYQAYLRMRHDIVNAAFAPGTRLRTRSLCERYEVGLAPVREALTRLSSEGLVVQSSRRGFAVPMFGRSHLEELTRTRCWISGLAVRASMAYADPTWEETLILAFHRVRALPRYTVIDGEETFNLVWEAAHGRFHHALVNGCRSTWIVNVCDQMTQAMNYYRHYARQPDTVRAQRSDEHAQIFDAVMAHDADLAVDRMNAHFTRSSELVMVLLDADEKIAAEDPDSGPTSL